MNERDELKVIEELYDVIVFANWYRKQDNYPEYVERAKEAVVTLSSYMPHPKAVEYLTKIGTAGYDTIPRNASFWR